MKAQQVDVPPFTKGMSPRYAADCDPEDELDQFFELVLYF